MSQHPVENDPRTFAIIGAAMEVHNVFGYGFLEAVYRHAFSIELQMRGVPFITEVPYPVCYKGQNLPAFYRADFLCYRSVIVEVKAISAKTSGLEQSQMLNYLKASGVEHGLLLNFGTPRLEYRRFVLTPTAASAPDCSRTGDEPQTDTASTRSPTVCPDPLNQRGAT